MAVKPAQETFVQVAPDSTGKKIRNLEVQAVITGTDGTQQIQTVLMQVVSLATPAGRVIDLEAIEYLPLILEELQAMRRLLESFAA